MDPLMDHVVLLHLLGPDLGKSKNRNCSLMRFGLQLRKLFFGALLIGVNDHSWTENSMSNQIG